MTKSPNKLEVLFPFPHSQFEAAKDTTLHLHCSRKTDLKSEIGDKTVTGPGFMDCSNHGSFLINTGREQRKRERERKLNVANVSDCFRREIIRPRKLLLLTIKLLIIILFLLFF